MSDLAGMLARFPRLGLAQLRTSLEPLKRLTAHLGGPTIWIKRDDATGLGLGGNKLRKLDFVLTEAMAMKADTLVSGGVVQSNSQRQVAAAAAKLGLECHLVVYQGRVAPPSREYERSGNALLNRLFGATLHDVPWTGDRNGAIQSLAAVLRGQGKNVFMVPYGVSSPLGAVGYASAIVEIAAQSRAAGFDPAAIVHCSGSGGTQAGLCVGASVAMKNTRIVGIDIDAEPARVRARVSSCAKAAASLLGVPFSESGIEVIAGHAGPAYGVPHAATIEAIRLAGALEGLVLDPVYTGKGLAGLIALVRAGRWRAGQHIVFLHTGGVPALFAYESALGILEVDAMTLDGADEAVRGALTRAIARLGHAPGLDELAVELSRAPSDVTRSLQRLADAHALLLHPGTTNPWVVHPFALSAGSCWVETARGGYWANCLYCACGIAAALSCDAHIHTRYGGEAEPVVFRVADGALVDIGDVFHLSTPAARWWDNVIFACTSFQPFHSTEAVDDWCRRHALPRGAVLSLPQLWGFARDWYGNYLREPWRKRSADEARQLFHRHGLTGPFWDLG